MDGSGAAVSTGPTVNLRSFQPDNTNGKIPAQSASVSVTYTHPNGTATDTKPVPIHAIDFEVTDKTITAGVTQANEGATNPILGSAPGVATMSTDPKVKIKLDPSCPRKTDCASNHRTGWLQTMLTNVRDWRFTHTMVSFNAPMPIRDAITGAPLKPFYAAVMTFTGDQDQQTAHHEDSPLTTGSWSDPRAAAPAPPPANNRRLRNVTFSHTFTAWLVVQNIEWSAHHRDTSFVFLGHFDWGLALTCAVDVTQALGSRMTPHSAPPNLGAFTTGKGAGNPVLTDPIFNDSWHTDTTAQPGI